MRPMKSFQILTAAFALLLVFGAHGRLWAAKGGGEGGAKIGAEQNQAADTQNGQAVEGNKASRAGRHGVTNDHEITPQNQEKLDRQQSNSQDKDLGRRSEVNRDPDAATENRPEAAKNNAQVNKSQADANAKARVRESERGENLGTNENAERPRMTINGREFNDRDFERGEGHESAEVHRREIENMSPDRRRVVMGFNERERDEFFRLEPRERDVFFTWGPRRRTVFWGLAPEQREVFWSLAPWQRGVFFDLTPAERIAFFTLGPDARIAFLGFPPQERYVFSTFGPNERVFFLGLPPPERAVFIGLRPWERRELVRLGPEQRERFFSLGPGERHRFLTAEGRRERFEERRETERGEYGEFRH